MCPASFVSLQLRYGPVASPLPRLTKTSKVSFIIKRFYRTRVFNWHISVGNFRGCFHKDPDICIICILLHLSGFAFLYIYYYENIYQCNLTNTCKVWSILWLYRTITVFGKRICFLNMLNNASAWMGRFDRSDTMAS